MRNLDHGRHVDWREWRSLDWRSLDRRSLNWRGFGLRNRGDHLDGRLLSRGQGGFGGRGGLARCGGLGRNGGGRWIERRLLSSLRGLHLLRPRALARLLRVLGGGGRLGGGQHDRYGSLRYVRRLR